MKAKIRKTGEIVDVICYGGSPNSRNSVLDYVNYIDSQGVEHTEPNHLNYYWDFELVENKENNDWDVIRSQAAIAAMQCILPVIYKESDTFDEKTVARHSVHYADALVEQLKKK